MFAMVTQLPPDLQPPRRTLWSRLRDVVSSFDHGVGERGSMPTGLIPAEGDATADVKVIQRDPEQNLDRDMDGMLQAAILPFPIHSEALLVKLADVLRSRIADRSPERNPLLLLISRGPASRLWIDRTAHVEFRGDRSTYHFAVEADLETTVTLETTDFDTLVRFVLEYVAGRLSEPTALEAAP